MRFGFVVMTGLAALVALYSLRFFGVFADLWLGVDPGIRSVVVANPIAALTHMLVAPVALLIGPFQFLPRWRERHLGLHRWMGRVYLTACVIGGTGGFATALHASGGLIASVGFGLLAIVWVGTTLGALAAVLSRNIGVHRLMMRFSYAMTFAAVTLRLQIPVGFMLGFETYSVMSRWLAYTSWIPNVAIVAVYSVLERRVAARTSETSSERPR